jgi:hypothetical protein
MNFYFAKCRKRNNFAPEFRKINTELKYYEYKIYSYVAGRSGEFY